MTRADDLLDVAWQLLGADEGGEISNAALCRSISTSYYAAFSAISLLIADTFTEDRTGSAWLRVFRALNHGALRKAKSANANLPKTQSTARIALILNTLVSLHDRRLRADYDPAFAASVGAACDAYDDAAEIIRHSQTIREVDPVACLDLVSLCLFPADRG